jgi:hypothetical protein
VRLKGCGSRQGKNTTAARVQRKKMQRNANKNKQNHFYFLLFSWPNRGFSKGYRGKNKKILLALNSRPGLQLTSKNLPFR